MDVAQATRRPTLMGLPWLLAGATVLAQIGYPLTSGQPRTTLTIVTVVLFFAASVTHALLTRGAGWTAVLVLVTAGGGLLVESVGVHTGVPFGDYVYADSLGAQLVDVPAVIPLAWTMMAYPALLVGRRLARGPLRTTAVAGFALASWDLFLDPQMVAAGHWRWLDVRHTLPGIAGIPVSNFVGWLVVALVMMALLDRLLPHAGETDGVPAALYLWTYASSVLANLAFFGRPAVALIGGAVMGVVAIPYAVSLRRPGGAR